MLLGLGLARGGGLLFLRVALGEALPHVPVEVVECFGVDGVDVDLDLVVGLGLVDRVRTLCVELLHENAELLLLDPK